MRVGVGLVAVLALCVCSCGERVEAPQPAGSPTTESLPTELVVRCTATTTEVSPQRVAAGPKGVRVVIENEAPKRLSVLFQNGEAGRRWASWSASAPSAAVEIAPGQVHVRCVDLDEPEHSEPVVGSAEARVVEVVAEPTAWTPVAELTACTGMVSSMVSDFVASDDDRPPHGSPVDAVREDGDVKSRLRPEDELRTIGYRQSERPAVAVMRGGRAVAIVGLQALSGRWVVGTVEACDDEFRP